MEISALKPGRSGPGFGENAFTHAPLGGSVGLRARFYLTSGPHILLPTKTSRAFTQFPDNSLFIVFPCCGAQSTLRCGHIWWCLVAYSIVYMLLGAFF